MSQTVGPEAVSEFIIKYRAFLIEHANVRAKEFETQFRFLRVSMETLHRVAQAYERKLAPQFNLFTILGLTRAEVGAHSAFIASLLDPQGTHRQGQLFLRTFLQYCASKPGVEYETFRRHRSDVERWSVIKEKSTSAGKLDIVIESREPPFLVVIENKIDAGEQLRQLARYGEWLTDQVQYPPESKALIYLTREGAASETDEGYSYCRLSYREDIRGWLAQCRGAIAADRVREAVRQYLQVLDDILAGEAAPWS